MTINFREHKSEFTYGIVEDHDTDAGEEADDTGGDCHEIPGGHRFLHGGSDPTPKLPFLGDISTQPVFLLSPRVRVGLSGSGKAGQRPNT